MGKMQRRNICEVVSASPGTQKGSVSGSCRCCMLILAASSGPLQWHQTMLIAFGTRISRGGGVLSLKKLSVHHKHPPLQAALHDGAHPHAACLCMACPWFLAKESIFYLWFGPCLGMTTLLFLCFGPRVSLGGLTITPQWRTSPEGPRY